MAFSETELREHLEMLEGSFWAHRRPPLHLRDKIREGQRIAGHSIELFFIRPHFRDPDREIEEPIAKITFVRSQSIWRIFWMRADGKWHGYPPYPEAPSLVKALGIIHEDQNGCFFG